MEVRLHSKDHKIMSMDPEKRERLLNAAMAEFCKGYKSASTDAIARAAGVSKGLVFHYFGTKDGLYEFLLWNTFDLLMEEYAPLIHSGQPDLLLRLWEMMQLKAELSYRYPAAFEFLTAAYSDSLENPGGAFFLQFQRVQSALAPFLYDHVDASLFREGIDPKKAADIIWWTLKGFSDSNMKPGMRLRDYQAEYKRYLSEVKVYFDLLRSAFYQ